MNDEGLNRLQIKNNPMEKKKFSVKFPSKKRMPLKSNKEFVSKLQHREESGWKFIPKNESKLSLLEEQGSTWDKRRHTTTV